MNRNLLSRKDLIHSEVSLLRQNAISRGDTRMNQHELDRQIATATGESVATIESLGFSLIQSPSCSRDRRRYFLPRKMGGKGTQRSRKCVHRDTRRRSKNR